jgi:hypothetical protein
MPKPPDSKRFNKSQQARRICLKRKHQETDAFDEAPESALGAGALPSGESLDSQLRNQAYGTLKKL